MASPNGSLSTPKATPIKTKTHRKPFQSYSKAPSPNASVPQSYSANGSLAPSPNASRRPSFQQDPQTPSRRSIHLNRSSTISRQFGHAEPDSSPTRQLSYMSPTRQGTHLSRPQRSCSPRQHSVHTFQPPTPAHAFHPEDPETQEDDESSPPPPPPPHRVAYSTRPSTPSNNQSDMPQNHSPAPVSARTSGQTPSPLRDAMDDVMSSLDHMQMRPHQDALSPEEEHQPIDPWSPEAFEEFRRSAKPRAKRRPRSSLGIASSQLGQGDFGDGDQERENEPYENELPQNGDEVEPLEQRLPNAQIGCARPSNELFLPQGVVDQPPAVPPKNPGHVERPLSSFGARESVTSSVSSSRRLRARKSAYELGRNVLGRTFSTKTSTTNSSSGVQSVSTNGTTSTGRTSQSIMSGHSAGGFSATSAGSYARRKWGSISGSRPQSVIDIRHDAPLDMKHASSAAGDMGFNHLSSYPSRPESRASQKHSESAMDASRPLGGLMTPKKKRSGFFKKLVDSAKAGAASTRSTIADGRVESQRSPVKSLIPNGVTAIAGGTAARDMGLGGHKYDTDWVQVRRDVNRSNSLSRIERTERIEKCQMMNYPVIASVDELVETVEGDEDVEGMPVQQPVDYQSVNVQLVDKSARFVNSLPPMTNAISLAQGYLCRPYRSDIQRLRAIFTWTSEKLAWEEDFEGDVDTKRVIQGRRGCAEEIAVLVFEMCAAVGLQCEVVRGYLKSPGEIAETVRPNHWWNAVVVDGCWRLMDCSLSSPTNPRRGLYSRAGAQVAENGFFLARPLEACYTHIPSHFEQQHLCPPIAEEVLLALPCCCPPYFKEGLCLVNYDTSLYRIENLELVHVQFTAPSDVECVAEVEARSFARDADGDFFESGDTTTIRALVQAEWVNGQKRFTVKAHLPGDEGQGTLKVFAGKRGLMHSVKTNPHPLAFTLPIVHTGENPPYEFLLRHPTPHALRHDLYVAQPQCRRLALNNTFVFAVRQHPSSLGCLSPAEQRSHSPNPFTRPSSAMSMVSSVQSDYFSQTSSNSSNASSNQQRQEAAQEKPAKLAIQSPSGKIIRLMRKSDNCISSDEAADGGVWETIIKVGERGVWRGLVLADRSARWCVFGEWDCV
ncbi:uncharacterized protein KY384_005262 [Bacidia gigantensis]|uniref:uncharacterized protein n=1 Tax=Bacidia gigantensis TaxID=2732470 RepID=UPI001D04C116|nr:uncharacterized protein KY384_005262 [Bacidia gigantensis]KAG8529781.1 hypothetical protein KY384_005262 [Bacidia gigantensis]